jgi:hypothetical protein
MRRAMTAAALATAAVLGFVPVAAQAIEIHVGRDHGWHHRHHHRWHGPYARGDCRVIITHRTNHRGERVTVRRRVCD